MGKHKKEINTQVPTKKLQMVHKKLITRNIV